ncbi:hypothetical protein [Ulvibacterium marinum]|uniref:hypothetical protein n=1 Tax=Ulvibacterium marinum TaxID=2419782 RepID=UPI002494178A|nr:hypothetical protein [Ulvibacterium marinum]
MEKFFYLTAMAWLGIYPTYAQDIKKSEDTNRDNTMVEKHWNDKSTKPYALLKREAGRAIEPQRHLSEAIGNSMGQYPHTDKLSSSNLPEMTVYEPKGNYKMRVFEVDSTKQFHLKIYKAL